MNGPAPLETNDPFATPNAEPNAEIDESLAELDALSGRAATPERFYGRLLVALAEAVGAEQSAYWERRDNGLRRVVGRPLGAADPAPPRQLHAMLKRDEPLLVQPDAEREIDQPLLVYPVRNARRTVGLLVSALPATASERLGVTLTPIASAFAEVAEQFELRRQVASLEAGSRAASRAGQFLLTLHGADRLAPVARAIAEGGARLLECDRLTVLLPRGGAWRVAAVSGVEKPSPRSDAVRGVERLAAQALRLGDRVDHRDGVETEYPPALERELQRHVDQGFARELVITPCRAPDDDHATPRRPAAALLVEQFDGSLPDPLDTLLPLVSDHAAVAVDRARHAGTLGALRRRLASAGLVGRVGRWAVAAAVAAAVVAASVALCVLPAELRVAAPGRLTPAKRSHVFAPLDATVARVLVGHGETVALGQPLVELRSEKLEIDLEQAEEALATTRQEVAALETAKLRASLPGVATETDITAVAARITTLREKAGFQRRRIALLKQQQRSLTIASPQAGRVVSWRPQDYLGDRPVRRGQRLLEVAAVGAANRADDGAAPNRDAPAAWTLDLDVPDRRTGHLLQAAAAGGAPLVVDYVIKSDPSVERTGRVTHIASATQLNADGAAVLRVSVTPDAPGPDAAGPDAAGPAVPETLRSGSTVLAKIRCGRRPLGYVWFHEAWEALQRVWF